ncbi:hypothetical protein LJPFL01_0559 [Lelliottia jeotgali]|nr:hypothetical protein LJPFL01_0559 [Lelliottia jeotgali]
MENLSTSEWLIERELPLEKLLSCASIADLNALADIITDEGRGRVSLTESAKKMLMQYKRQNNRQKMALALASEICMFGGNTVANAFRKRTNIPYDVVAKDVAKKLGAKVSKKMTLLEIERAIIENILSKSLKEGQQEELIRLFSSNQLNVSREQIEHLLKQDKTSELVSLLISSCGPYAISRMVNSAMVPAIKLAAKAGLPALGKVIAGRAPAMLNPIAAVVSAAWLTYDLTGPAYRVTIPAVIRIACIRLENIQQQTDQFCSEMRQCL